MTRGRGFEGRAGPSTTEPAERQGPVRVAVLLSGGGSNLGALLEAERATGPAGAAESGAAALDAAPSRIVLVVSDRPGAGGLERARAAGIATAVLKVRDRPAVDVAADLRRALVGHGVELVLLAGYLRLLPAPVVQEWSGRVLNIHPALLPAFGGQGMWGRHVHEAVLRSGARWSGPTVHLVDERYDEGRILAQWPVPVQPRDTADTLAARVLAAEHRLFPIVVARAAEAVRLGREIPSLSVPPEALPGPFHDSFGAVAEPITASLEDQEP